MIVKLKNVKPNNDDTITLYLDKGADLMFLIGLRGKEIDIDAKGKEHPAWEFDRLMPLIRYQDAFINSLIKRELEAKAELDRSLLTERREGDDAGNSSI